MSAGPAPQRREEQGQRPLPPQNESRAQQHAGAKGADVPQRFELHAIHGRERIGTGEDFVDVRVRGQIAADADHSRRDRPELDLRQLVELDAGDGSRANETTVILPKKADDA